INTDSTGSATPTRYCGDFSRGRDLAKLCEVADKNIARAIHDKIGQRFEGRRAARPIELVAERRGRTCERGYVVRFNLAKRMVAAVGNVHIPLGIESERRRAIEFRVSDGTIG